MFVTVGSSGTVLYSYSQGKLTEFSRKCVANWGTNLRKLWEFLQKKSGNFIKTNLGICTALVWYFRAEQIPPFTYAADDDRVRGDLNRH